MHLVGVAQQPENDHRHGVEQPLAVLQLRLGTGGKQAVSGQRGRHGGCDKGVKQRGRVMRQHRTLAVLGLKTLGLALAKTQEKREENAGQQQPA